MVHEFIKLDKNSETVLNKICKYNNFPVTLNMEEYDAMQIQNLINYNYLYADIKINTFGAKYYIVTPTYNGEHYCELKRKYIGHVLHQYAQFWFPVLISIGALIVSIIALRK